MSDDGCGRGPLLTAAADSTSQVQVHESGMVTYVAGESTVSDRKLRRDSGNLFRVRWAAHHYPRVANNCSGVCEVDSDTCVCDVAVERPRTVFTDNETVPALESIDEQLRIGSVPPAVFDDGTYKRCASAACLAAEHVVIYTRAASGGAFDEHTIFMVLRNSSRPTYLVNQASTVTIAGSQFSFRNPPKFNSFLHGSNRDAANEVEALLDHLLARCSDRPIWRKQVVPRCGDVRGVEGQRADDFCHDVAGAHYKHALSVEDIQWPVKP